MSEPAGGFQDPEEVFGKMFGGDRFDDLIGQISIGEWNGTLAVLCDAGVEVEPLLSAVCPHVT